jgi:integrase
VASLSLGYDAAGKRKRLVIYGATKRDVQLELDRLKQDAAAGMKVEPTKATVKDLLDRWLELEVKTNRAPGTYRSYTLTAKLHITPHIGGVRLADLDAMRVAGLYAELEKKEVPARTRELVHAVLRRALKRAVAWKLKGFNPAAEVERPKVIRRDIPVITPEQASALLEAAAGHRLESLFVFAIASGMRQGELFGLRWQDVDTKAGAVHVRHSLEELDGKLKLKEPKTKAGKRTVILPAVACEALAEHQKRMLTEGHYGREVRCSRTPKGAGSESQTFTAKCTLRYLRRPNSPASASTTGGTATRASWLLSGRARRSFRNASDMQTWESHCASMSTREKKPTRQQPTSLMQRSGHRRASRMRQRVEGKQFWEDSGAIGYS